MPYAVGEKFLFGSEPRACSVVWVGDACQRDHGYCVCARVRATQHFLLKGRAARRVSMIAARPRPAERREGASCPAPLGRLVPGLRFDRMSSNQQPRLAQSQAHACLRAKRMLCSLRCYLFRPTRK